MDYRLEVMHLRRQMLELRNQLAVRPMVPPLKPVVPNILSVQIIGGQTLSPSGIPVIQYVADPLTVPTAYDPNVATSYVAGIGNGVLYNQLGQQVGKVLVRHNWVGFQDPLVAGDVYTVVGLLKVAVTGGGFVAAYEVVGMW